MFIPIIGQTKGRLGDVSYKLGRIIEGEACTAEETVTILGIMLVRTCKHAEISREVLFKWLVERFEQEEVSLIRKH